MRMSEYLPGQLEVENEICSVQKKNTLDRLDG